MKYHLGQKTNEVNVVESSYNKKQLKLVKLLLLLANVELIYLIFKDSS